MDSFRVCLEDTMEINVSRNATQLLCRFSVNCELSRKFAADNFNGIQFKRGTLKLMKILFIALWKT